MYGCFIINGIKSDTIGISGLPIVSVGSSTDDMIIYGGQSATFQKAYGEEYSSFIRSTKNNITFTLTFSLLDDSFSPQNNYRIGEIFSASKPVPFILEEEDNTKMLYVIATSSFEIQRYNPARQGTVDIKFEATTPYWLTYPVEGKNDPMFLKVNETFTRTNVCNIQNQDGTYDVFPFLKFKIMEEYQLKSEEGGYLLSEGSGYQKDLFLLSESGLNLSTENYEQGFDFNSAVVDFEIRHISDNNRIIKFNGLQLGEEISIYDRFMLESSTGMNRFKDWNKEVFYYHKGINTFQVNFPCIIESVVQYPIIR